MDDQTGLLALVIAVLAALTEIARAVQKYYKKGDDQK